MFKNLNQDNLESKLYNSLTVQICNSLISNVYQMSSRNTFYSKYKYEMYNKCVTFLRKILRDALKSTQIILAFKSTLVKPLLPPAPPAIQNLLQPGTPHFLFPHPRQHLFEMFLLQGVWNSTA